VREFVSQIRRFGNVFNVITAFVAGIAFVASPQGVATRNVQPEARGKLSAKPFLATFTDIAAEAGLQMSFTSGNEKTKKYIIEANGTGVAFIDYDNDGWLDIFLVNGSTLEGGAPDATSRLYRNKRDGGFTDVTREANVGRSGWGNGVCAGDIDNDGFEDLFVTYWGHNALYRNTGKGRFEEIAAKAGVAGSGKEWSSGCTFLDYDRDGRLDLFVASYQKFDLATAPLPGNGTTCEWKGMPVFCGPRGLPFGTARLFHGRADGTFEDVTQRSRISEARDFYAFTAVAVDLNEDRWTDIYVASDSTPSLFFRNNKDGTFSEIATETGIAFNEHGFEQGGMGVAVGDFDGNGKLDLLKTNFSGDHPNLYQNLGKGIFEDVVIRAGLGVNPQYVGWGVAFADFDNDSHADIFQVNGHVYPELEARKEGDRYRNPRLVYRNLGEGRFEDVSSLGGRGVAQLKSSRGAAFGDFDNDGDIDVVIMNMGERPSLLRNDSDASRHSIKVKLRGTRSNRSAIGAIVTVAAGGRSQLQPVLSQSSFISQNDFRLHFGLGSATKVDGIMVVWPNGETEEFPATAADRTVLLVESSGAVQDLPK
jgi:enediyne biosynthesis protein E4